MNLRNGRRFAITQKFFPEGFVKGQIAESCSKSNFFANQDDGKKFLMGFVKYFFLNLIFLIMDIFFGFA